MTYKELYLTSKKTLKLNDIESYSFEASQLIEYVFKMDKTSLIIHYNDNVDESLLSDFNSCLYRRLNGEPLQYIMGYVNFYGARFIVGKGVLIPRFDTEILVEVVENHLSLNKKTSSVIDLCAGSGAISITLASIFKNSRFFGVELSKKAFEYFRKNIDLNHVSNITPVLGDIFKVVDTFANESLDVIVSNPPYIESSVIPTLQKEVLQEPEMALDGGKDGLDFYRKIINLWTPKLKKGGFVAFEIGENQEKDIKSFMQDNNYSDINFYRDYQGIIRVISGIKNF
ncbi:MAG: peptide chain release factor N(5)-glutamine methyltransferase [Clostridia bacterium]|nr:peptide chain release factor N(5)-glutamine methyltransferase [Clostridia bacterium]